MWEADNIARVDAVQWENNSAYNFATSLVGDSFM